jgi:hypothetical protein
LAVDFFLVWGWMIEGCGDGGFRAPCEKQKAVNNAQQRQIAAPGKEPLEKYAFN